MGNRSIIISVLSTLLMFLLLGFQNCGTRVNFAGSSSDQNLSKMPGVGNEGESGIPLEEDEQERAEDGEPDDHDEDDEEECAKHPRRPGMEDDYESDSLRCDQDPRDRSANARVAKTVKVKTDQLFVMARKDHRILSSRLIKIEEKAREFDVLSLRAGVEIEIPSSLKIDPSKPRWLLFHLESEGHEIAWSDNSKEELKLSRGFFRNDWRFLRVLVKTRSATEIEAGKSYIVKVEKLCLKHLVKRSRSQAQPLELRKRVIRQRATITAK